VIMASSHYEHECDNDPSLDWEWPKRLNKRLVMQQLEKRLALWKQKQEERYLELYRSAINI